MGNIDIVFLLFSLKFVTKKKEENEKGRDGSLARHSKSIHGFTNQM